jgi:hypothetical protein
VGKFLVSNYQQVLSILKTKPTLKAMEREGIMSDDKFGKWLAEEKTYLLGLKNVPKASVEMLDGVCPKVGESQREPLRGPSPSMISLNLVMTAFQSQVRHCGRRGTTCKGG